MTAGLEGAFWRRKRLDQLDPEEWESLCDGCGICCQIKFEQPDGQILFAGVACRYLDTESCRCRVYQKRAQVMEKCMLLSPANINDYLNWLPETCAYRRLAEGRDLCAWHPLLSGDPESVHRAGVSVRGRVISAGEYDEAELEDMLGAGRDLS